MPDNLAPVDAPADLLDEELVYLLVADNIFFRKARYSAADAKALPPGLDALRTVKGIGLGYLLVDALL